MTARPVRVGGPKRPMRRARGPGAEAARLAPAWRRVAGCRQNNLDGHQINLNEIPL